MSKAIRGKVIDGLNQCTENQQLFFKKIYSHADLTADLADIVNNMPPAKLRAAARQIERTLEKNARPPKPEPPQKTEAEKAKDLAEEAAYRLKNNIICEALDRANDDFYETKMDSVRSCVGGEGQVDFEFENATYTVTWMGFWEKSDWYDWRITSESFSENGTKYID